MKLIKYTNSYQKDVKDFVIAAHDEFNFPYDRKLDYDLDNPDKYYNNRGGMFYLLLDNEKVIGTAAVKKLDDKTAALKRLYVNKNYRGKGLGLQLFTEALDFCRENKIAKVVLDTNIKQKAAQKLYEKNGFKIDRVDKNTIFMSKILEK